MQNRQPKRRFTNHFKSNPMYLEDTNPSVMDGRTIFPSRVKDKQDSILKSAEHQRKIGSHVTKGKWKGMPIYTLTLEERATCPRSCFHWNSCYGNHMHHAPRQKHGEQMERDLEKELTVLNARHDKGFIVRLHLLGDFYSVSYVMQWGRWLQRFQALHVFGYTARDPLEDIGVALSTVYAAFSERWWIRWSHRDKETWLSTGDSGIVCPAQTGATDCCGTCGLCWTVEKPIRFLVH